MFGVTPGVLIHIDDVNLSRTVLELYSEQATSNGCRKANGTWVHNSTGDDSENPGVTMILSLRAGMNEVVMLIFPSGFESPLSFLDYHNVVRGLFDVQQQLVVETAA